MWILLDRFPLKAVEKLQILRLLWSELDEPDVTLTEAASRDSVKLAGPLSQSHHTPCCVALLASHIHSIHLSIYICFPFSLLAVSLFVLRLLSASLSLSPALSQSQVYNPCVHYNPTSTTTVTARQQDFYQMDAGVAAVGFPCLCSMWAETGGFKLYLSDKQ